MDIKNHEAQTASKAEGFWTTQWPRVRFLYVILVIVAIDFLFTARTAQIHSHSLDTAIACFVYCIRGPFAAPKRSFEASIGFFPIPIAPLVLLPAYLMKPNALTFWLSMLGGVLWISSGILFVALLM